MARSVLITQCLQNDFVKLLEKHDRLPNLLHIGYDEALRILGARAEEGPVLSVMNWAYGVPEDELDIINIRDWHDAADPEQKTHLEHFGPHCIKNTPGAEFVFSFGKKKRKDIVIDASGLNDFEGTDLRRVLDVYGNGSVRIGIMGVWTEAKITFLAYELRTRYRNADIAVCSALCASSSRSMHFIALDQLSNILGVRVFSSIGAFTEFLTGASFSNRPLHHADAQAFTFSEGFSVSDADRGILHYLYRDAREVSFRCLDGGFSGNVVAKAAASDIFGHAQVPTVVKIGDRDLIARERIAFERIQEVLGNSAPNIVDFAEIGSRGGIKYRYAAMLDGSVRTFQSLYAECADEDRIEKILSTVFRSQLGRLYSAATLEKTDILECYEFSPRYADGIRRCVESLPGVVCTGDAIDIGGITVADVCSFYRSELKDASATGESFMMSYVHGDLNGANILIDAQENVWIIDFFHTSRSHVLKDLAKLENDILYIFTKIRTEEEFREAMRLTDELVGVEDLGVPLPDGPDERWSAPQIAKAYRTIRVLRSFYPRLVQMSRDPYQLHAALLRYAMHTLSFDESDSWQKKWALYSGAKCVERIRAHLRSEKTLRIDFIRSVPGFSGRFPGRLGITMLPGRRDRGRDLAEDIAEIRKSGVTCVVCMLSGDEFEAFGVGNLKSAYADAGFDVLYFPVLDQKVPAKRNALKAIDWIAARLTEGRTVLVHCVGGLGRSGMLAASFLALRCGIAPDDAIELVRESRSPRAVETKDQIAFVRGIAG